MLTFLVKNLEKYMQKIDRRCLGFLFLFSKTVARKGKKSTSLFPTESNKNLHKYLLVISKYLEGAFVFQGTPCTTGFEAEGRSWPNGPAEAAEQGTGWGTVGCGMTGLWALQRAWGMFLF